MHGSLRAHGIPAAGHFVVGPSIATEAAAPSGGRPVAVVVDRR